MENEELYKQLLLMKREYARKKKRLELAIQAKNSPEASCMKKISMQLKTHPATCEMGNEEFCDRKDEINSSQVKKIKEICVSEDSLKLSLNTCKTENFEKNIPSNSLQQKSEPIKSEIACDFKPSPLPTKLLQRVESDLQTPGNSLCSYVSSNTSKISLKTKNDSQHEWKTCLSNSFVSGESTKKLIPNETSETLKQQMTIPTNIEDSDLVCSTKQINEEKLASPSLHESPHIENQSGFEHNQFETDNDFKNTTDNSFDSNHISKSDEELISSELFCDNKVNIPPKSQEVSSHLQTGENCMKNQATLNRKTINDTDSHQIFNSSASIYSSDEKIASQSLQCCHLNQGSEQTVQSDNQTIKMGRLSSDHAKNYDSKEKQLHTTEIPDKLVVKQLQKNPFSLCDLKLTQTEKISDINDEVVSLLNASCSVSIHRDFTVCEDYLVGVTKSKILFWTYTENKDWHRIYQWKVSDHLEECSTASLHPYDSAVCVAVLGLKAEMHHSLILSTFQGLSKRSISVAVTSVISLSSNQIIYCSLNSFELAVASTSNNENTKISKIYLLEDFTAVKEQQSLESTSEKLLSLATIQRLPAGLIGLTVTNVLLIWNHTTNLLLIKVPLTDINENCCYIPTAMNLEGHVIFPVLFKESLELGSFVALNPTTLTVSKLLSYENISHFNTSLKPSSAQVFDKTFVSFNENILGLWDLFSGYLMASIYCSNISSVTIFHSVNQLWLITSQKGGCIHWYSS